MIFGVQGPSLRLSPTTAKEAQLIHTGETIENPITGERITFLATSADTDGEAVVIETVVEPHGFVAAASSLPATRAGERSSGRVPAPRRRRR